MVKLDIDGIIQNTAISYIHKIFIAPAGLSLSLSLSFQLKKPTRPSLPRLEKLLATKFNSLSHDRNAHYRLCGFLDWVRHEINTSFFKVYEEYCLNKGKILQWFMRFHFLSNRSLMFKSYQIAP